jgi:hypothetical protein
VKETKEKAHVSNTFNFAMPVGTQFFCCCSIACADIQIVTIAVSVPVSIPVPVTVPVCFLSCARSFPFLFPVLSPLLFPVPFVINRFICFRSSVDGRVCDCVALDVRVDDIVQLVDVCFYLSQV